jgi:hypothetical protein
MNDAKWPIMMVLRKETLQAVFQWHREFQTVTSKLLCEIVILIENPVVRQNFQVAFSGTIGTNSILRQHPDHVRQRGATRHIWQSDRTTKTLNIK